ncbi:MAG: uroporphyrinogen decarboxylase family protein, partial [bacterium]
MSAGLPAPRQAGLLTPRERFGLLVIDEPQDRVPVYPLVTVHACRVAGITVREYVTDGVALARAQLAAQERYGHDFISV